MSFKQLAALMISSGRLVWRDRKCRFSLTKISAPTYSAYAAISASAGLRFIASYFEPNSKGISESSSIMVLLCRKSINSLNASMVRLWRTSVRINRGMRIKMRSGFLAIRLSNSSHCGSRTAPKVKMYTLLSRMSNKFFFPEFLSSLADFVYYLLFSHIFVRGASFRHQTADFFQMLQGFLNINFFHSITSMTKCNIFLVRRQE